MSGLLSIYSTLDLQKRTVQNRILLAGIIIGLVVVIVTGHIQQHLVLHLTSIVFMSVFGYLLFRLGAFGGADVKTACTIAVVSPGIEFTSWNDPILEAIIISGLQLIIMLIGGYLISKTRNNDEATRVIPLIPFLWGAYLVLQILAFF